MTAEVGPAQGGPEADGMSLQALADLRVLELGHAVAGPLACGLLGDFGADVIKIELPGEGDMARSLGPRADDGVSAWWKTLARNKRCVALDWKSPDSHPALRLLVERAHVLVENFRPGVLERAGLGPDILHGWNADLVILRISGYGQDGPYAMRPGFGRAGEALSGFAHLTGFPDGPPLHSGYPVADTTTGLMGAFGVLVALEAVRSGRARGQVVDLSIYEPLLRLIDYHVPIRTGAGPSVIRGGTLPSMSYTPGGVFRTRDGRWVTLSAGSAATGRRLLAAVGGEDWAAEPRFRDLEGFTASVEEIQERLSCWIGAHDLADVLSHFAKHNAVAAVICDTDDILADPQVAHRDNIASVPGERTRVVDAVPKLGATPGAVRWLGRAQVGADTTAVLREAGCAEGAIAALLDSGTAVDSSPLGAETAR